jgi:peptide/nickel transport system permease protein
LPIFTESGSVAAHIAKRLIYSIPVVLLVSIWAFSLLHLSGGDPAQMMLGEGADPVVIARVRADLGLDRPLHEQYWNWLSKAAQGDLGRSILPSRLRVGDAIMQRAPVTVQLGLMAMVVSLMIGIPAGILAGVKSGTRFDFIVSNLAVVGIAIPNFLLALLLILVFSLYLRVLPPSGYTPPAIDLAQNLRQMVLPSLTLGAFLMAFVMRITRASILEVMQRDFIRTGRSKGLSEKTIVLRHAVKPALMPVVTITGLQLGAVLGGSVIIESIFALPGLGKLTIDSIYARDFPMLQGSLLVLAIGFVLVNIAVDVSYTYLDPRIRYD